MKDIKSLYLTAKSSGRSQDITAYSEAVQELLESDPNGYMSNLRYIIQSSIGLQTLNKFVEKYGLPIACWENVMQCLEECVEKCNTFSRDASGYKAAIAKMEAYQEQYANCFMMYEAVSLNNLTPEELNELMDLGDGTEFGGRRVIGKELPEDIKRDMIKPPTNKDIAMMGIRKIGRNIKSKFHKEYVETYYGFNENGIQNRKLLVGMIKQFGETAIPDMIITANQIGGKALEQTFKYLESYTPTTDISDAEFCQWVTECMKDVDGNTSKLVLEFTSAILNRALETRVEKITESHQQVFREAAIMGDDNAVIEYTEAEITTLQEYIAFKEYQLTCMESSEEAIAIQKEIYSLYEFLDGIINEDGSPVEEEVADSVAPMLPKSGSGQPSNIDEAKWMVNTRNKKTGDAPGYLANNHNLDYEPGSDKNGKPESDPDIDTYKRPSAGGDPKPVEDPEIEDEEDLEEPPKNSSAVNNYYYYTYNNSLNKNSHSFNQDKSSHDDHSDHSMNKRISSNGDSNTTYSAQESFRLAPWELSESSEGLTGTAQTSSGKAEFERLKQILNREPTEKDIPTPDNNMIITFYNEMDEEDPIEGKNCIDLTFDVEPGKVYGDDGWKVIKSFDEVPLAVHALKILTNGTGHDTQHPMGMYQDLAGVSHALRMYLKPNLSSGENMHSGGLVQSIKMFNIKGKKVYLKKDGNIGIMLESDTDPEHGIGININFDFNEYVCNVTCGQDDHAFESVSFAEAVGMTEGLLNVLGLGHLDPPLIQPSMNQLPPELITLVKETNKHVINLMKAAVPENKWDDVIATSPTGEDDNPVVQTYRDCIDDISYEMHINDRALDARLEKISGGFYSGKINITPPMGHYYSKLYDAVCYDISAVLKPIMESVYTQIHDQFNSNNTSMKLVLKPGGEFPYITIEFSESYAKKLRRYVLSSKTGPLIEAVGDADDHKPESDHPIQDTLTDIDRGLTKTQQAAKKKVQQVQNAGRTFMKPIKRSYQWVTKMVDDWKDKDENQIKEKLADPHARKNIFSAISWAIKTGSLAKAGLLLNPIFLFLTITKKIGQNKNEFRLRNEMIGELKTEIEVIDEKIKDADANRDLQAKYKLMRLKNEINKKLVRVGGSNTRRWRNMI